MNASDDRLRRNRQNHVGRGLKAEVLIGCETHKLIRETDKNRDRWGLTNLDYSRTKRKKKEKSNVELESYFQKQIHLT